MSSSSEVQLIIASNYLGVSAITLYLFDYCITFSRERKVIWSRKVSTASILYLLIRYAALTYHALFLYLNIDNKSCGILWHVLQTLDIVIHIPVTLMLAIRIYAVTGRNPCQWIAAVLLMLNFVSIGANIFAAVANALLWGKDVELETCSTALTFSQNLPLSLATSTYVSAAISDVVAVWMTCSKYNKLNRDSGIRRIFWVDGVSDFIIFLFINLLELLSNLPAFPYLNAAIPLLRVIPPITTYRFILKVRSWVPKKDPVSPEGDSGDWVFLQHAEEAEYGRPDLESQLELQEMRRALHPTVVVHRQISCDDGVELQEQSLRVPPGPNDDMSTQTEDSIDSHDIGAPGNV